LKNPWEPNAPTVNFFEHFPGPIALQSMRSGCK